VVRCCTDDIPLYANGALLFLYGDRTFQSPLSYRYIEPSSLSRSNMENLDCVTYGGLFLRITRPPEDGNSSMEIDTSAVKFAEIHRYSHFHNNV
jgi:hypothetical protein